MQKKRWYLWLVFCLFLGWKFFLIGKFWNNRDIPPSPIDAYTYITHIESVRGCDSLLFCTDSRLNFSDYGSFEHLSYRLFWGALAKVVSIDSVTMFHWSFYLGTILLFWVLYVFLKSLGLDQTKVIVSLLFLGLYYGAGSYHGFFWVVPSFFSLVIFLLLFSLIGLKIRYEYFVWLSLVLVPVGVYNHSMFLYLIFVLPIFWALIFLYKRNLDWKVATRLVLVFVVLAVSYGLVTLYLKGKSSMVNGYGYTAMMSSGVVGLADKNNKSGIVGSKNIGKTLDVFSATAVKEVERDYINWIAPRREMLVVYLIVAMVMLVMGDYRVVFFWLATLIFTMFSLTNVYGVRSLLVTWPATYIMMAVGWVDLHRSGLAIKNMLVRNVFKILLWTSLFGFVVLNGFYSMYYATTSAEHDNYVFTPKVMEELSDSIDNNKAVLASVFSSLLNSSLAYYENRLLKTTSNVNEARYCVLPGNEKPNSEWLKSIVGLKNVMADYGMGVVDDGGSERLSCPAGFGLVKTIGGIKVYKKN